MSHKIMDPIDAQPFRDWCNERLRGGVGHSDEIGHGAAEVTVARLAFDLGITSRRLHRWRFELPNLDRPEVEEALHHADVGMWEVYPDLADEAPEATAFCPGCRETVPVDGDERCLWCSGATREKSTGGYPAGIHCRLKDDHLLALHRFHADGGVSIRELGRRIWRRAGFGSAESASQAIREGFRRLRLPVYRRSPNRSKTVARCTATKTSPPRAGMPCRGLARPGSEFCAAHDPERREEVVARARVMREARVESRERELVAA